MRYTEVKIFNSLKNEEIIEEYKKTGLVVIKNNQNLSIREYMNIAKNFSKEIGDGTLHEHPMYPSLEGSNDLIVHLKKEPNETINTGNNWHADETWLEYPISGSLILAKKLPPVGLGNTYWINSNDAYENLSEQTRTYLENTRCVHGCRHKFLSLDDPQLNVFDEKRDVMHPAIINHPLQNKKSLFVNNEFCFRFEGKTVEESKPIFDEINDAYMKAYETKHYCHVWDVGDMVFWDDRSYWHRAENDYNGYLREMWRISITPKKEKLTG